MATDTFFESPKSWSKRKHRLLSRYLPPFSAKVGSWAHTIYCVDGFAGKAKYGDGSAGSPLLMAQLADKCAGWSKPVLLKIINVESNPSNFRALVESTAEWQVRGTVTNKIGEFGSLVSEIILQIGSGPAFFFIDPYGPTSIPFRSVEPILRRSQKATELIINFDADGLRRIGDTIRSKATSVSAQSAIKTNVANVDAIVGSDRWQNYFLDDDSLSSQREIMLVREYCANIAGFDYKVAAYGIRQSVTNRPKYYLIYCTRHSDGMVLMNSLIRDEEDALIAESIGNEPLLPSEEFDILKREVRRRRLELEVLICGYLSAHPRTTRGQLRTDFVFERFGEFHDKDYNSVVKKLIDSARVKTAHGRKRINDDEPLIYLG